MFANPRKRIRRWKDGNGSNRVVYQIVSMEDYNRAMIGLFICFALVRNFLPKLIDLNFKLKDLVPREKLGAV